MEAKLTEVMTEPLPETSDQTIAAEALSRLQILLEGKQALALGPGLSVHKETVQVVLELIEHGPCPIVLDADGVNSLVDNLEVLTKARAPGDPDTASRRDGKVTETQCHRGSEREGLLWLSPLASNMV